MPKPLRKKIGGAFVDMTLERVRVDALMPYAGNAKLHPARQLDVLEGSIGELGFAVPVIVNEDGVLIAGHARVEVARRMQLEEIPALRVRGLSHDQERALRLADNRVAELGEWSSELLQAELRELERVNFSLESIGFDEVALEKLFADRAPASPHPEPVAKVEREPSTIVHEGDRWQLGTHVLVCGDSTDPRTVALALGDAKPLLMVTDPPYGVDYNPSWRNDGSVGRECFGESVDVDVLNDSRCDWAATWALFPGDVAYVWHAALRGSEVRTGLEAAGFELRAQIVWAKQQSMISRGHYHWQHEPCWYAVRAGASANWCGDRKQSTVWNVNSASGVLCQRDGIDERQDHATQKPVELYLRAINNHTHAGDAIFDPFCGSGTALVAAEHGGRRCIALDVDPRCVELALKRWRKFTGAEPTRDGRALAEFES